MPWLRGGTVAVVNGSTTVTGTNANFVANSKVGDAFVGPDGSNYEIGNVASSTVISIIPAYKGATVSGSAYAIMPVQGYNKDTADAFRALAQQFGGVLAVLGNTPTQAGVRTALNLTNTDGIPEGATNKYMTASGVRGITLAGLDLGQATAVVATDTVLAALGKLQAQVAAASAAAVANGVGRGYIDGLTLGWISATSISVGAGSAYVPSVNKVVAYTGGNIVPSGAANSFIHVYLTDTGVIEQSATAPARYSNQAHQKTGDNTRRYIGSLLVGTANNVYKFHHHPLDSSMSYTFGNPSIVPFRLLNGVTGVGSVSTSASCPVTAHTIVGSFQTNTGGIAQFTPSDAGTSATTGWQIFVSAGSVQTGNCRIADDKTVTYYTSSSNLAYIYTLGYYFDR